MMISYSSMETSLSINLLLRVKWSTAPASVVCPSVSACPCPWPGSKYTLHCYNFVREKLTVWNYLNASLSQSQSLGSECWGMFIICRASAWYHRWVTLPTAVTHQWLSASPWSLSSTTGNQGTAPTFCGFRWVFFRLHLNYGNFNALHTQKLEKLEVKVIIW